MDEKTRKELELRMQIIEEELEATNKKFETLKKVIGTYLELSSNLSLATVKANLKNV